MKKLTIKIIIFILPFLFLGGFLEIKLKEVINSYNYKKMNFEKMLSECEVLIFGNSMAYCGIDPDLLKYSAFNLANNSQDFYYDQMLYSKYLERLPKLKYVIIPIAFISLFYFLDQGTEDWRASYYLRFFNIPKRQKKFDLKDFSMVALYGINFSFHYLINTDTTSQVSEISVKGWRNFSNIYNFNEKLMADRGRRKFLEDIKHQMELNRIDENVDYLHRIIDQSRKRNIITILISLPASKYYARNLHDNSFYSLMQERTIGLSQEHGITYSNYIFDDRFIDRDFSDAIHLNSLGAKKLSRILNQELLGGK